MKRITILIAGLVSIILFSFTYRASSSEGKIIKIKKVVIDAGHGGHDPGAVGAHHKESHVALAIALKLGSLITENYPDVEVIYTRKTDVFVELHNRAKIANENKADLFISIHCNSTKTATPSGTETWVKGLNKSGENLEVAKKENAAILMESDYSSQYDGYDPNSAEAYIIFSLYQNIYLNQSLDLASKVQTQFEKSLGRVSRGVKQAGFLVLYKTTMPGILVETGFISNRDEEAYMASDLGQLMLASAIYRAFKDYKASIETGSAVNNEVVKDPNVERYHLIQKDSAKSVNNGIGKEQIKTDTVKKPEIKQDVFFRVQFSASAKEIPINSKEFAGVQGVRMYLQNGLYKYTAGNENTVEAAVAIKNDLVKKGYKDAFVVAFFNEQRITVTEELEILKKQKK